MTGAPTLHRLILAVACATTVACADEPTPIASYVVPAHGQSSVARDAPLLAFAPNLVVPDDYPMPDVIRVVDLADEGFVAGSVWKDGDAWWFQPDAPWTADHRFAWTLDAPAALAHGPQFEEGTAFVDGMVFDTSANVAALSAGSGSGSLCITVSEDITPERWASARLSVDDVAVVDPGFVPLPPSDWAPDLPVAPQGASAPAVGCTDAAAGSFLRLWIGADGPWLLEIGDATPAEQVAALYRRTP